METGGVGIFREVLLLFDFFNHFPARGWKLRYARQVRAKLLFSNFFNHFPARGWKRFEAVFPSNEGDYLFQSFPRKGMETQCNSKPVF